MRIKAVGRKRAQRGSGISMLRARVVKMRRIAENTFTWIHQAGKVDWPGRSVCRMKYQISAGPICSESARSAPRKCTWIRMDRERSRWGAVMDAPGRCWRSRNVSLAWPSPLACSGGRRLVRVFACIVTYEPDVELLNANIAAVLGQVEGIVLVDNASSNLSSFVQTIDPRVHVLRQSQNQGLSRAMNAAVRRARTDGADAVLMLDQDSVVSAGAVSSLSNALRADPGLAIVAAHMVDRNVEEVDESRTDGLEAVNACITSGSLVRLSDWAAVGGWDENLFIDYVDFDFCLRLRMRGKGIRIDHETKLDHAIGNAQRVGRVVVWGHGATRLEHMANDVVRYAKKHRRSPAGLQVVPRGIARAVAGLCWKAAVVLRYEQDKSAKLRALVRGTARGFLGGLNAT
ncbi:hypothetical protein DEJ04_06975 [Curtobacterium sp. MCLR17_044]|nr:hypothetical protein DEJ04_06975 [Curtobacterium sp. MCLR17_044]